MAHSSKKAITGCLWFCITPRTDQPSLLFMFLSSCHRFLKAREEKSGFQKGLWPMPWKPKQSPPLTLRQTSVSYRQKGVLLLILDRAPFLSLSQRISVSPSVPTVYHTRSQHLQGSIKQCVTVRDMGCFWKKSLKLLLALATRQRIKVHMHTIDSGHRVWISQPFVACNHIFLY